jgi:hypothetical protein
MLIGGGGLKVIIIVTVTLYFNAFFLWEFLSIGVRGWGLQPSSQLGRVLL